MFPSADQKKKERAKQEVILQHLLNCVTICFFFVILYYSYLRTGYTYLQFYGVLIGEETAGISSLSQ